MKSSKVRTIAAVSAVSILLLWSGKSLHTRYLSQEPNAPEAASYLYVFKDGKAIAADTISSYGDFEVVNKEKVRFTVGTKGWLGPLGPQTRCITMTGVSTAAEDKLKPFVYWIKHSEEVVKTAHLPAGIAVSLCDRPLPVSIFKQVEYPVARAAKVGEAPRLY